MTSGTDTAHALKALHIFVAQYRTQREAASALKISAVYLGDLLHERRPMTATVLASLGLERIVTIRKKRPI